MNYAHQLPSIFKPDNSLASLTISAFSTSLFPSERLIRYIKEIKIRISNKYNILVNQFYIIENKDFIQFFHPVLKYFLKKYYLTHMFCKHYESNSVTYSNYYRLNFRSKRKSFGTLMAEVLIIPLSAGFYTKTCSEIEHGNGFVKKFVYRTFKYGGVLNVLFVGGVK